MNFINSIGGVTTGSRNAVCICFALFLGRDGRTRCKEKRADDDNYKNEWFHRKGAKANILTAIITRTTKINHKKLMIAEIMAKTKLTFDSVLRFTMATTPNTIDNKAKIGGLFDNNKNIWGNILFGHKVESVEKIKEANCDLFVICTLNQHNTEQLLQQAGELVGRKKLITLLNLDQ